MPNAIALRKPCHSEGVYARGNPFSKGYYGLPRIFDARNDSLNLMTLRKCRGPVYEKSGEPKLTAFMYVVYRESIWPIM